VNRAPRRCVTLVSLQPPVRGHARSRARSLILCLVRCMPCVRYFFCSIVLALLLSACADMTVGDVRVHSLFATPRMEDIRAVIAANPNGKIYEIQVTSPSEMLVYYEPIRESIGYATVRRINGKWVYVDRVIITS
jgi:hypothetical protein